jgi:alkanesulfonate monooxygenase SsuD/methylene tetrahydromethanopterin reductase-like flavin-dependent oxidoreductase (luciferase family)
VPSSGPEFFLYLPQLRLGVEAVTERALAAERSGFTGIAFMDHLAPPLAETSPMLEAMTLATWVAARTTTLVVGHLVLCDAFRHPAVLARQAVTLDHASGGRFELGLGWGSMADELTAFGITDDGAPARAGRLGESLELIEALWQGDPVRFRGTHFQVDCPGQRPSPLGRIPVVVGGTGPRTLALARRHADWWNVPTYGLDRLEELRPLAGDARVSTQHLVGWVDAPSRRDEVEQLANRRFGTMQGLVVGDADGLRTHFARWADAGVERFYVWFTDFAVPGSLASFGEQVISPLGG